MKLRITVGLSQPTKRRRFAIELSMLAPPDAGFDSLSWLDRLSDEEFADMIGPSWSQLTGRRIEDLGIEWTTGDSDATDA